MTQTYINDTAESPDSTGPVLILLPSHVLGEAAGHNNDIVGYFGHLLDGQIHQPTKSHILRLEELGHTEERLSSFSRCKMCALGRQEGGVREWLLGSLASRKERIKRSHMIQEVENLGEDD